MKRDTFDAFVITHSPRTRYQKLTGNWNLVCDMTSSFSFLNLHKKMLFVLDASIRDCLEL